MYIKGSFTDKIITLAAYSDIKPEAIKNYFFLKIKIAYLVDAIFSRISYSYWDRRTQIRNEIKSALSSEKIQPVIKKTNDTALPIIPKENSKNERANEEDLLPNFLDDIDVHGLLEEDNSAIEKIAEEYQIKYQAEKITEEFNRFLIKNPAVFVSLLSIANAINIEEDLLDEAFGALNPLLFSKINPQIEKIAAQYELDQKAQIEPFVEKIKEVIPEKQEIAFTEVKKEPVVIQQPIKVQRKLEPKDEMVFSLCNFWKNASEQEMSLIRAVCVKAASYLKIMNWKSTGPNEFQMELKEELSIVSIIGKAIVKKHITIRLTEELDTINQFSKKVISFLENSVCVQIGMGWLSKEIPLNRVIIEEDRENKVLCSINAFGFTKTFSAQEVLKKLNK